MLATGYVRAGLQPATAPTQTVTETVPDAALRRQRKEGNPYSVRAASRRTGVYQLHGGWLGDSCTRLRVGARGSVGRVRGLAPAAQSLVAFLTLARIWISQRPEG